MSGSGDLAPLTFYVEIVRKMFRNRDGRSQMGASAVAERVGGGGHVPGLRITQRVPYRPHSL
jgi:hypothetical protein